MRKSSIRRARRGALAVLAGLGLVGALAGAGGAAADPAPAAHTGASPGWRVALSGAAAPERLQSVTAADADHAWAAGAGEDGTTGRSTGVITRWDGTGWTKVTDPGLPSAVGEWSAVDAAASDDVWAYGSNADTQFLAHFDGHGWTTVPTTGPFDRDWVEVPIKAVRGRLFKGGDALYTYADGQWQTFALPAGVDIRGIDARSADDAYATGMQFPVEGGHPVVYHWDGTTWHLLPQPAVAAGVSLDHVAVDATGAVYASGWGRVHTDNVDTVVRWNGTAWKDVTGGLSGFVLEALRPDGHGGLWAAGTDDGQDTETAPLLWHYDGTGWEKQPGTAAPAPARSYTIHALATAEGPGGSAFWAVGDYSRPPAPDGTTGSYGLIERTQNSLDISTADLAPGATTRQTVRVHAESAGRLSVSFRAAPGQPAWNGKGVDIKVTSVDGGPDNACTHTAGPVGDTAEAVSCDLTSGDYRISYGLATRAGVPGWQLLADARFQAADPDAADPLATVGFAVDSAAPVTVGHRFLARDAQGVLWSYDGTGNAAAPYRPRAQIGTGWQQYTALTALSDLTVRGEGDAVARDAGGTLWLYPGGGTSQVFASRLKVGGGWNTYTSLTGAGDLTGDGRADLLGRDASGALWLYAGTGSPAAPFAARVKVGGGWNAYTDLTGAGDLTGDGRADLLARDASGALWLYAGTGKPAAPYAAKAKVGTGWSGYNALLGTGDLTGDGRADFLARDASGALWLYAGTGSPAAPYAARVKAGTGWGGYNALI